MKILALDTASSICSVALLEDNTLIQELNIIDEKTHSEKLMPLIDELLKKQQLSLKDINLVTANRGPGSFTGIRIGVATAKAFCDANSIPFIGVSSLRALAYSVCSSTPICSLIDAKNNNVYFGLFQIQNGVYHKLEDYYSDSIDMVLSNLSMQNEKITFVGDGSTFFMNKIQSMFAQNAIFAQKPNYYSTYVGKAGFYKYTNKKNIGIISLDDTPLYLRPSNAERTLKETSK